jgi:acyl-CoA thioesterase-1
MPDQQPNRYIPAHADAFGHPLPNFTKRLVGGGPVKIVALGSSSTAGEGSIVPYPARLEAAMRAKYGDRVVVLNRGKSGEEAPKELIRMTADVIDEDPALVIWQVGTNAVFHDYNPDEVAAAIAAGLDWLAGLPMDVVLMDPQYTRAITGPDKLGSSLDLVSRISAAAEKANVNVFRRFALMQRWVQDKIPIEELDDGGQLHTSEWATACVSQALFDTIVGAPQAAA